MSEGTVPFPVAGEVHQTYFKIFGNWATRTTCPLVVLHGGPGLSHDYMLPLRDLAHATDRPVLFYDQLGNGRSTRLPGKPRAFWTINLFVAELENVLSHFAIADGFDLLGHAWGGVLGLEFALRRRPRGLRHLVLAGSLASMAHWKRANARLLGACPEWVRAGMKAGPGDLARYREAARAYYARHGCTIVPLPAELEYSLSLVYADDADRSVNSAM